LNSLVEADLYVAAQELARDIDSFLIERKGSVLDQLVAIGGVEINETFEIQVKVRLTTPSDVIDILESNTLIAVVKPTVRRNMTRIPFQRSGSRPAATSRR